MQKPTEWAYGVTTCLERLESHLPATLLSLKQAGFPAPRLFLDGGIAEVATYVHSHTGLEVSPRFPRIRLWGNWILGLQELYLRQPYADRYALFQDDLEAAKGLREYLEATQYPNQGKAYLNLYTFLENEEVGTKATGWHESSSLRGKPGQAPQRGRGALGLVFNRDAVTCILGAASVVKKPQDPNRGWRNIDGAIVQAMNDHGFREYVHNPTLVNHTGIESAKGEYPNGVCPYAPAKTWKGTDWNCLSLLAEKV